MSKHSILVALSGSEQSRNAAELAWFIADKIDAAVTAEQVIDSRTVWELLRSDKPGFIGSGLYVDAYEKVIELMKSLSNQLVAKYEAEAEGRKINGKVVAKEGNPVEILTRDAKEHDLLVLGHSPSGMRAVDREYNSYIRRSIAEGIAHESPIPVLIVQSKPVVWQGMTIVSEMDHLNTNYIRACLRLALLLGLTPRLEFWATGVREEKPNNFKRDLIAEIPEAKSVDIEIEYFEGHAVLDRKELMFEGKEKDAGLSDFTETLFVLPTRGIGRKRITVLGAAPENFIASLTLPCLLLWPEDHAGFKLSEEGKNQLTTATKE